jgi:nucleotide-binding universal stress UspA family protein
MAVQHIIVGIDDSQGSEEAVRWAAELAGQLHARVTCVHAFEPLAHLDELEPGVDLAAIRERLATLVTSRWSLPLIEMGVDLEIEVHEGLPADVLVKRAVEVNADLIVVGARRLGWLKELVLGSTSHRVLHEAKQPVVVIHPDLHPDLRPDLHPDE